MNESSERRLAENEVMFRHANSKNKGRQQRAYADADSGLVVNFFCECSNRNCHERIAISVEDYEKAHQNNKQFIALPGHENTAIEWVVKQEAGFNVIQKYVDPAEEL